MKPEWRRVLEKRSVKDKIAIARDCELLPVGDLNIISELVREGMIVWIDRTILRHLGVLRESGELVRIGVSADVYQLTTKGISLCRAEGIPQR